MNHRTAAPGWAPERDWAQDTVRAIALPTPLDLPGLIQALADHLGTPLAIGETDARVVNGALELRRGVTTICIPAGATGRHRRFMICRGLARALYRAPGARDGILDLSQPLEREVEFAALALAQHLYQTRHHPSRSSA